MSSPVIKPTVYIETTVVSYLTARQSQDTIIAGHQQTTRDWWKTCHDRFELFASLLVLQEASRGNPEAAQERLKVLNTLTLLDVRESAEVLAQKLVDAGAIPEEAVEDALHIAIAATNGMQYLVTWNYRHIANATKQRFIAEVCEKADYQPVVICTPEQLMEES